MYKVYEAVENHIEKLGKSVKKCIIQKEGLQYPFKNVTVWPELPIYAQIQSGFEIPAGYVVDEKDSKNINPLNNKPYKERTLVQETNANGTVKVTPDMSELARKVNILWSERGGTDAAQKEYNADADFDSINAAEIPF